MTATPTKAFVMQTDATSRHATAAVLRDLGFDPIVFDDPSHLYAYMLRSGAAPHGDATSFVVLSEPTAETVAEFEVLRSGHWPMPLVLVGRQASRELARRLRAAWLPCERPTRQGLRRAIATARNLVACDASPDRTRTQGATREAREPVHQEELA
jgi:hypothetical protein